jgi:hypothetical protein
MILIAGFIPCSAANAQTTLGGTVTINRAGNPRQAANPLHGIGPIHVNRRRFAADDPGGLRPLKMLVERQAGGIAPVEAVNVEEMDFLQVSHLNEWTSPLDRSLKSSWPLFSMMKKSTKRMPILSCRRVKGLEPQDVRDFLGSPIRMANL